MASVSNGPGVAPLNKSDVGGSASRYIMDMPSNRLKMEEKSVLRSIHYKGEEYATGGFEVEFFNARLLADSGIRRLCTLVQSKPSKVAYYSSNLPMLSAEIVSSAGRTCSRC